MLISGGSGSSLVILLLAFGVLAFCMYKVVG
jgi:hypothetical protein